MWVKNSKRMGILAKVATAILFLSLPSHAANQETFLQSNTPVYSTSPTGMTVTKTMLGDCHASGVCTATPAGNAYLYPISCSGSGSNTCTGCWTRIGGTQVRAGDLNSSNSCPAGQFKVFVGYQMSCPGASPCTNGKLILGCSIQKIGSTADSNSMVGYSKECFGGSPIVVDATNAPNVCGAGEYRDSTDTCVSCPAGTYKSLSGDSACIACGNPNSNVSGGVGSGTPSGPVGATSLSDCTYPNATCTVTGETWDPLTQSCQAPPCSLIVQSSIINPNSGASPATKGQIYLTVSGATGTATTSILSGPTAAAPQTGTTPVFSGLDPGVYTINTADSACYQRSTITLTDAPACNLKLTLSSSHPRSSPTYNDGGISVNISGATGTATSQLTASSFTTQSTTGNPASFTGLSANTYQVKVTDTACTKDISAVLVNDTSSGCPAGQFLASGVCSPCANGTYKENSGDFACTACSRAPVPGGTLGAYTTTPATGATSSSACSVEYTCNSGYTAGGSSPAQINDPTISCTTTTTSTSCTLALTASGANPTAASTTDGSISGMATGAAGALSFSLSPAQGTLTASGGSVSVTGLAAGSYTLTATDAGVGGCWRDRFITLTDPVAAPAPSPSPTNKMLAYGKHSYQDCDDMGGVVVEVDVGGVLAPICRFSNINNTVTGRIPGATDAKVTVDICKYKTTNYLDGTVGMGMDMSYSGPVDGGGPAPGYAGYWYLKCTPTFGANWTARCPSLSSDNWTQYKGYGRWLQKKELNHPMYVTRISGEATCLAADPRATKVCTDNAAQRCYYADTDAGWADDNTPPYLLQSVVWSKVWKPMFVPMCSGALANGCCPDYSNCKQICEESMNFYWNPPGAFPTNGDAEYSEVGCY